MVQLWTKGMNVICCMSSASDNKLLHELSKEPNIFHGKRDLCKFAVKRPLRLKKLFSKIVGETSNLVVL